MRPPVWLTGVAVAVTLGLAGPAQAAPPGPPDAGRPGASCVGTVTSQTAATGPGAVADEVRFVRETLPLAFPGFERRGQAVRLLAQADGDSAAECRRAWFRLLLDGPAVHRAG